MRLSVLATVRLVVGPSVPAPGPTTTRREGTKVHMEVPGWALPIALGFGALIVLVRRVPIFLRACQKVVSAWFDLVDEVDRRRRARFKNRASADEQRR